MRGWSGLIAVAFLLAGCSSGDGGGNTTDDAGAQPTEPAGLDGYCVDAGTTYANGTALVHVTASGLMPAGSRAPDAPNVTISAQLGGSSDTAGREVGRSVTDDRGCVQFQLKVPAQYRFATVREGQCDVSGSAVATWNGKGVLQVELRAGMPCS